jgi:hypothetical protein
MLLQFGCAVNPPAMKANGSLVTVADQPSDALAASRRPLAPLVAARPILS